MRHTLTHIIVTAALALTACCAHTHSPIQPPTSGYFGVIHPGKTVQCVDADEAGLNASQCAVVQAQIESINRAVGYELLHFGGFTAHVTKSEELPGKCEDIILIGSSELPGSTIGLTVPRCMQSAYIMGEVILLDPFIWDAEAMHGAQPADVVLHELLHALGLGHADKDGAFDSIMKPAVQKDVHGLQPGDLASLRNVYK